MGTARAHPLYFATWPLWEDIWDAIPASLLELAFFCRRMSNVVPIMSVKAWLAGTNDYLSGDPLAGRVGQSLVVVMVGEDGCSAGM